MQIGLFGRHPEGEADELVGFVSSMIDVDGGRHPIVEFNGKQECRVGGTVFDLTEDEITRADAYEPEPYRRISTKLASGKKAWVYARAGVT